jgi:phosphoglycolate phosphatase
MPFEVILFDYDGTLFDTRPAIVHCILSAFARSDRSIPSVDQVASAIGSGLPLRGTLLRLDETLRLDTEALDTLVATYRQIYLDESAPLLRPFPGVADALGRLHALGKKSLVVSNKGVAAIHRSLEQHRLSALVEMILGDQPGLPAKPDPALVSEHVLPRYGQITKRQMLMIGDTEVDIVFARQAGISACWAAYGYGESERCLKLQPEHQISDVAEIPELVGA